MDGVGHFINLLETGCDVYFSKSESMAFIIFKTTKKIALGLWRKVSKLREVHMPPTVPHFSFCLVLSCRWIFLASPCVVNFFTAGWNHHPKALWCQTQTLIHPSPLNIVQKLILSHLEPTYFTCASKLHPTSANHRSVKSWGCKRPKVLMSDPETPD